MQLSGANKEYWEHSQGGISLSLPDDNPVKKWLDASLDFSGIKSCFEIGCYPGKFLSIFANKGIEVNGIDYHKNTSLLKEAFKSHLYKVGEIFTEDFAHFPLRGKYDCVCSFGFIEHFQNWSEILQKQIDLVEKEGCLILEVPNFRGILQRIPRYLFDNKNLKRHNLESMDLKKWEAICKRNNIEIIYKGYFAGYLLWFENSPKSLMGKYLVSLGVRLLKLIRMLFRSRDSEHFSGAMGLIGIKH
jgi:SAM-dependent methyltransferase